MGSPDFYSESRRSVYELKFTRRRPKLYEHHRLRACVYKWLSDAELTYLLCCSPRGFLREYEVNNEFSYNDLKSLMGRWSSPMWEWGVQTMCMIQYVH